MKNRTWRKYLPIAKRSWNSGLVATIIALVCNDFAIGLDLNRVGPLAPNLTAYAERWVQSIQQECLDRFLVFGEDHLRHIVREYVAYYNDGARPHQGVGNVPLTTTVDVSPRDGPILCRERLGGPLKRYYRAAARHVRHTHCTLD